MKIIFLMFNYTFKKFKLTEIMSLSVTEGTFGIHRYTIYVTNND